MFELLAWLRGGSILDQEIPPPLHVLISQINAAANNDLHVIAIGMAVALPAICASLAAEDGRSQGKEYRDWCRDNLKGPDFNLITPEVLYGLRCGVLHQGRAGDLPHAMSRVVFPIAGPMFSNYLVEGAYFYSVKTFCENMGQAALRWYEAHKSDPIVEANLSRMMQYHMDGFEQIRVKGLPLIT